MALKKSPVHLGDLKPGLVFINPEEKDASFYKIYSISTSAPGKHGTTKSMISAKNLINGKILTTAFNDKDRIYEVNDFNYQYKVIYNVRDFEMEVDSATREKIHPNAFSNDDKVRLEKALTEFTSTTGLKKDDSPLVIKYSINDDESNILIFWELLYMSPQELPKHGINNYNN